MNKIIQQEQLESEQAYAMAVINLYDDAQENEEDAGYKINDALREEMLELRGRE